MMDSIAVIGAGAWGIALSCSAARSARDVSLWMRNPVPSGTRALPRLPQIVLPDRVRISGDMPASADVVLLVVPTQTLRSVSARLGEALAPGVPVIVCCKGLEATTSLMPLDILAQTLPGRPTGVLSGPNFAIEVAQGRPAAATLACQDMALATHLASALSTPAFRLYASDDPTGVQLAGAAKNVVAIGAGIAIGAGLGENARAALITRSVAEIGRLAAALGGNAATIAGLSGVGDLILTCTGAGSRNYSLGLALGEGRALQDILAGRSTVAEGVTTARPLLALAQEKNVDVPIMETISRVLDGDLTPAQACTLLLERPPTRE